MSVKGLVKANLFSWCIHVEERECDGRAKVLRNKLFKSKMGDILVRKSLEPTFTTLHHKRQPRIDGISRLLGLLRRCHLCAGRWISARSKEGMIYCAPASDLSRDVGCSASQLFNAIRCVSEGLKIIVPLMCTVSELTDED